MPRQFGKQDESVTWAKCSACERKHRPGSPCPPINAWLARGDHVRQPGVIWLKRAMPPDQWPPDQRAPRDNTFRWWVRAHCGHKTRQFAFYEERDADAYEYVFRSAPCWWARCGDDRPARQ